MDDLISRRAAIDAIEKEQSLVERPITETRWFDLGLRKARDVLSALPSAQPDIVRCKDCTRYEKKRGCNLADGLNIATENGFCSYGERKRQCTI